MAPLSPLFTWRSAVVESTLPATAKHVALTLSLHMNERGGSCFPSLDTLQEETGRSRNAVRAALEELVQAGWVERKRPDKQFRGRPTHYKATVPKGFVHKGSLTDPLIDGRGQLLTGRGQKQAVKGSLTDPESVIRTSRGRGEVETIVQNRAARTCPLDLCGGSGVIETEDGSCVQCGCVFGEAS